MQPRTASGIVRFGLGQPVRQHGLSVGVQQLQYGLGHQKIHVQAVQPAVADARGTDRDPRQGHEVDLPAAGRVDSFDAQEAIRRADALMADYPAVLSRLKDKSAAMARAAGENERLLLEMLEQHRMH